MSKSTEDAAERVIAFLERCGDADIEAGVCYILGMGDPEIIKWFKEEIQLAITGSPRSEQGKER